METVDIKALAERVNKFLSVNREVSLHDLKLHLGCQGTILLIASGLLVSQGLAEIKKEGETLWITLKK